MGREVIDILFHKLKTKVENARKLHRSEWLRLSPSCKYRTRTLPLVVCCGKLSEDNNEEIFVCAFENCPLIR